MYKRIVSGILSILMVTSSILVGCGGTENTGSADIPAVTEAASDEKVTPLKIAVYAQDCEPDGRLNDPVTKWIEKSLNVELEVIHTGSNANWGTQLASLMAANDLPDIFLLNDPSKDLSNLIEADQVLCLDDYLDNAVLSSDEESVKAMMEANRTISGDGKLYTWGMKMGSDSDGTVPTFANYIRWDLYSQLGYPEINSYEELLDILEQMVALEPQTESGLKTYALGGWFAEGEVWAMSPIFSLGALSEGKSYSEGNNFVFQINTSDSQPIEGNMLTNPDSRVWTAVDFFAEAYRRGLLDPDSFTMTQSMWEEKLNAGQYMFEQYGWEAAAANNAFNQVEGNTKEFISLPSLNGKTEGRIENYASGGRKYCVSKNTKYPEKCIELLDFMTCEENSFILHNGLEGDLWEYDENGIPVPTDEYLNSDPSNLDFILEHGNNMYVHFNGYCSGSYWEKGKTYMDLWSFSDKANEKKMTTTKKDFIEHYGCESQAEVYAKETEVILTNNYYTEPAADEQMTLYLTNLTSYLYSNLFNMIMLGSESEYDVQKEAFIASLDEYHINEIYEFYYNAAIDQADEMKKIASYFE